MMIMGLLRRGLLLAALLKASMGFSLILHQSPMLSSSPHNRYSATTLQMGLRSFIQNRVKGKDKKEIFNTVAEKRIKQPPASPPLVQPPRTQVVSTKSNTKGDTAAPSSWHSKTEIKEANEIKEAEPFSYRLSRLRLGNLAEEENEEFAQNSPSNIDALGKFSSPQKPPSMRPPRQRNPMFEEFIGGQKKTEIVSDQEIQKMEFLRMVTDRNRFNTVKREESDTIIEERRSGTMQKDITSPLPISKHPKKNDLASRLKANAMAQERRDQEQRRKAEEERQEAQLLKDRARRRSMEQQAILQAESERKRKRIEEEEAQKEEELNRMKAMKQEELITAQEEYWNNKVQKERKKKNEVPQDEETLNQKNDQSEDNQAVHLAEINRARKYQMEKLKAVYSLNSNYDVEKSDPLPSRLSSRRNFQTKEQQQQSIEERASSEPDEEAMYEAEEQERIMEERAMCEAKEQQRIMEEKAMCEVEEQQRIIEEKAMCEAEEQRHLSEEKAMRVVEEAEAKREAEEIAEEETHKEEDRLLKTKKQSELIAAQEEYWSNRVKMEREKKGKVSQQKQKTPEHKDAIDDGDMLLTQNVDEVAKVESHEKDPSIAPRQKTAPSSKIITPMSFFEEQAAKLVAITRSRKEKMEKLKLLNSPLPTGPPKELATHPPPTFDPSIDEMNTNTSGEMQQTIESRKKKEMIEKLKLLNSPLPTGPLEELVTPTFDPSIDEMTTNTIGEMQQTIQSQERTEEKARKKRETIKKLKLLNSPLPAGPLEELVTPTFDPSIDERTTNTIGEMQQTIQSQELTEEEAEKARKKRETIEKLKLLNSPLPTGPLKELVTPTFDPSIDEMTTNTIGEMQQTIQSQEITEEEARKKRETMEKLKLLNSPLPTGPLEDLVTPPTSTPTTFNPSIDKVPEKTIGEMQQTIKSPGPTKEEIQDTQMNQVIPEEQQIKVNTKQIVERSAEETGDDKRSIPRRFSLQELMRQRTEQNTETVNNDINNESLPGKDSLTPSDELENLLTNPDTGGMSIQDLMKKGMELDPASANELEIEKESRAPKRLSLQELMRKKAEQNTSDVIEDPKPASKRPGLHELMKKKAEQNTNNVIKDPKPAPKRPGLRELMVAKNERDDRKIDQSPSNEIKNQVKEHAPKRPSLFQLMKEKADLESEQGDEENASAPSGIFGSILSRNRK